MKKFISVFMTIMMTLALFVTVSAEEVASQSSASSNQEGVEVSILGNGAALTIESFEYASEEAKAAAADVTKVNVHFNTEMIEEEGKVTVRVNPYVRTTKKDGTVEYLDAADYKLAKVTMSLIVAPTFKDGQQVSVKHYKNDDTLVRTYEPLTVKDGKVELVNEDGFSYFVVTAYEAPVAGPVYTPSETQTNTHRVVNTSVK